jgi:hypothetical protein
VSLAALANEKGISITKDSVMIGFPVLEAVVEKIVGRAVAAANKFALGDLLDKFAAASSMLLDGSEEERGEALERLKEALTEWDKMNGGDEANAEVF